MTWERGWGRFINVKIFVLTSDGRVRLPVLKKGDAYFPACIINGGP